MGGGCKIDFRFFSTVGHTSIQRRTPAPRGMASQHLLTFERALVNKELLTGTVPFNKKLLTCTVLVNNLFLKLTKIKIKLIKNTG